jgi:hypothetical protein
MPVETGVFTVGVFQDVEWATRGIDALKRKGIPPEALSAVAKESPEAAACLDAAIGRPAERIDLARLGTVLAVGPLIAALDGDHHDLAGLGLAGTMRRVGFQPHDGQIFETLTGKGGILVAIHSEPRAADALAVLHAYGGGNAAIGAWIGRL